MSLSKAGWVSIVGGVLAIVSVFLPWYSFDLLGTATTFKAWNTSTAWVLIVLALLGMFFAWKNSVSGSKGMGVGALLMGLFIVGVVSVNDPSNAGFDSVLKMYGFNVSLVSGLIMLVGGIMALSMKKNNSLSA